MASEDSAVLYFNLTDLDVVIPLSFNIIYLHVTETEYRVPNE